MNTRTIIVRIVVALVFCLCLYGLAVTYLDLNYTRMSMWGKWSLSREALSALEKRIDEGNIEEVKAALRRFNSQAPTANHHAYNNLLYDLATELSCHTNALVDGIANKPSEGTR